MIFLQLNDGICRVEKCLGVEVDPGDVVAYIQRFSLRVLDDLSSSSASLAGISTRRKHHEDKQRNYVHPLKIQAK